MMPLTMLTPADGRAGIVRGSWVRDREGPPDRMPARRSSSGSGSRFKSRASRPSALQEVAAARGRQGSPLAHRRRPKRIARTPQRSGMARGYGGATTSLAVARRVAALPHRQPAGHVNSSATRTAIRRRCCERGHAPLVHDVLFLLAAGAAIALRAGDQVALSGAVLTVRDRHARGCSRCSGPALRCRSISPEPDVLRRPESGETRDAVGSAGRPQRAQDRSCRLCVLASCAASSARATSATRSSARCTLHAASCGAIGRQTGALLRVHQRVSVVAFPELRS